MNNAKVLIAADASEASLRAVIYTGDLLGKFRPDCEVCLLYVESLPEADMFPDEEKWKENCHELRNTMQEFLSRAKQALIDRGISASAIESKYVVNCHSPFHEDAVSYCSIGLNIAQDILNVQREGGFGTIAMGRRHISKAEEFLFGSVSNKIIHEARDCAVWVVE